MDHLVLLRAGHVQEVYALCRSIDEASDDITFLALDDEKAAKHQQQFIEEFFQEELETSPPAGKMSSAKRHRVPRKSIHAALGRTPLPGFNPSDTQRVQGLLHKAYSGYVHGAYPHTMELYGADPPKYHTSGMLDTPLIEACEAQFVNYVYRALLAAEIVAARSGRGDVQERLIKLAIRLARLTRCVGDDEIELASQRLTALG